MYVYAHKLINQACETNTIQEGRKEGRKRIPIEEEEVEWVLGLNRH